MTVKLSEEYRDTVAEVAEKSGLPTEFLTALLDLELQHPNLHGYGARGALRSSIAQILEGGFLNLLDGSLRSR